MRAFVLVSLMVFASGPALAAGGAEVFGNQCASCHGPDAGGGDLGPSLKGVVGRKVASLPNFAYSDALKARGGVWTEASLNAFLANPQAAVPGTTMFGGAPDPADRKAVIDYLKTVK